MIKPKPYIKVHNVGPSDANRKIPHRPQAPTSGSSVHFRVNIFHFRKSSSRSFKFNTIFPPPSLPPSSVQNKILHHEDQGILSSSSVKWEGPEMESQKRNRRARKPLADCTNTILSSQSSASNFSASIKPRKRLLESAVKDVINNEKKSKPSLVSESTSVNLRASNPSSDILPTEPFSDFPPAEPNPSSDSLPSEPSSTPLPTEVSTPLRRADLPSTSGADRVSEPQSFYSRRPTNKRKSVEIAVAPFIFSTTSKIQTGGRKRDGYDSPSRARTVPCKKRQRATVNEEDESNIELPREFVEQQKAYFSEVDAFELPVEEAKSSDSE